MPKVNRSIDYAKKLELKVMERWGYQIGDKKSLLWILR
jgi:hypothetical protein